VGIITVVERQLNTKDSGILETVYKIIEEYSNGFPKRVDLEELRQARILGLKILNKVLELHKCVGCQDGKGFIDLNEVKKSG
jgi:hypothetical protein